MERTPAFVVFLLCLVVDRINATNSSNSSIQSTVVPPAVELPPAHAVSTCSFDDSSQPSYQSHYLQSATSEVSNMEFVVPPGTKGCLLVFSCAANTDPDYDDGQAMTVRASVNSFLSATLYAEDGTVLVPSVGANVVATTTVVSPTSLYVAFEDNGASRTELGRLALSISCVRASVWIGALPHASATNIFDANETMNDVLTSSLSYKSWVHPGPIKGGYPTLDRKAYFFACPSPPPANLNQFQEFPLLRRSYVEVQITGVKGYTDIPPDKLAVTNMDAARTVLLDDNIVNWEGDTDPVFRSSGSGYYVVWGTGDFATTRVSGIRMSYTCNSAEWRFSGLAAPPVVQTEENWFTPTRIILLSAGLLLFFIAAVLVYVCCCRTPKEEEVSTVAIGQVPESLWGKSNPRQTSSAPARPAPSVISSETSTSRAPPSQADTAEYRSQVGDAQSTVGSESSAVRRSHIVGGWGSKPNLSGGGGVGVAPGQFGEGHSKGGVSASGRSAEGYSDLEACTTTTTQPFQALARSTSFSSVSPAQSVRSRGESYSASLGLNETHIEDLDVMESS